MERETTRFALRVYPGLMLRDWYLYLDQIVIGLILSSIALGNYAVAAATTMALSLLSSPIVNTVQPVIQRSEPNERVAIVARFLAATILLISIPAVALTATAPLLIPFVYGQGFSAAVPLTQVLAVAGIFDAVAACAYGALVGIGRPGRSSISVATGVAANLIFLAILLPLWGLIGAALASLAAYSLVAAVSVAALARALSVRTATLWFATIVELGRITISAPRRLLRLNQG